MARYLRINHLIRPIKELLDTNRIAFLAAVDMSYLADEEQKAVYKVIDEKGMKLKPKMAAELRKHTGELTEDAVEKLIGDMTEKKPSSGHWVNVKLPDDVCRKHFAGLSMAQITEVVEQRTIINTGGLFL